MIAHVCSLAAGNDSHPTGSSIVKEVYDRSGRLQGWTAMVKTQADSAGWFSVEIASTTDGSKPVVGGNGIPLCFGCHSTEGFRVVRPPVQMIGRWKLGGRGILGVETPPPPEES